MCAVDSDTIESTLKIVPSSVQAMAASLHGSFLPESIKSCTMQFGSSRTLRINLRSERQSVCHKKHSLCILRCQYHIITPDANCPLLYFFQSISESLQNSYILLFYQKHGAAGLPGNGIDFTGKIWYSVNLPKNTARRPILRIGSAVAANHA